MHERDDPLVALCPQSFAWPPKGPIPRMAVRRAGRGAWNHRCGVYPEARMSQSCWRHRRGFMAHMLDATMGPGVAITLAPGQFPTTVEFKVCFLRPIHLGTVIGRARIVHRGEAMVFAEGELRDPDHRLLATATATLRIVTISNVELDFGQGVAEHKLSPIPTRPCSTSTRNKGRHKV